MGDFEKTITELSARPEVEAVVLGGSRASGKNDALSDYDVYVYLCQPLSIAIRQEILQKTCRYIELNNTYWETEDDCVLNSGVALELIYRNLADTEADLTRVLLNHQASSGYSTCQAANVMTGKILYDTNKGKGSYAALKSRFSFPYPKALQQNIIQKNRELLSGKIPSYDKQIAKAIERNDLISVNHRITEFLASYFDIIFSLNCRYHPGEKRLTEICLTECEDLPEDFQENLEKLFSQADKMQVVSDMTEKLDKLLKEKNLFPY